jgi:hypothetical protein
MMMKGVIVRSPRADEAEEEAGTVDTDTVLDNVVELDRLLDEVSRKEVDSLPVLELSKHMRVRSVSTPPEAARIVVDGDRPRRSSVDAVIDDRDGRRRGPAET